jgi:AcrR family transcriptional regulator
MPDGSAPPRAYRSQLRQRQAAETRRRVVEAAGAVFSEHGYQNATFAQIAKRAGVSVETVQKHGPKSALMWASVEMASVGVEGEVDIFATDIGRAMLRVPDANRFAAFLGETMLTINQRAAGVWSAVTGAAHGDAELRRNLLQRLAGIRRQIEKVLDVVAERGWLRTDVPFDELVEACCVITSVESYLRIVHLDGRSELQYKTLVARMVLDTVLRRPAADGH